MKTLINPALAAGTLATLLAAGPAFALPIGAEARLNAEARLRAPGATTTAEARIEARQEQRAQVRAEKLGQREEAAKQRASNEIDRRIKALTQLGDKVGDMRRVSDGGKTSIDAMVQAQVTALNDLKLRIAADDSTTTLKADMQSITTSYRVFALVIPQGHIKVAADKVHTSIDTMTALIAKLTTRLADATTKGEDVVALQARVVSAQAQLAAAGVAADAAVSLTAALNPDNGDKTLADANKKALQDGRAKIQEAMKALQAARADIKAVVDGIKALKLEASASTTISVQ